MMTKRMRSSITGMLNEVDETLLKMAQYHTGNMDESACYEAVREIRLKRVEIKTRFERRFINLFENEIQLLLHSKKNDPSGYKHILRNNSIQDLNKELKIPLENTLRTVRKDCGQILLELDKKIGLLLDTPNSVNPMQPAFVFEAFSEACWDINSGDEVRLMMFRIFERRIAEELKGIYEDINKLLEGQNDAEVTVDAQADKFAISPGRDEETVMLRYEVINRIENRLSGHQVPEFVRHFLLKHWRVFLENIYSNYSENSIAWNAARQTMDDLIWIVAKPVSHYDRQYQVQLLPSLLFRLLNGMKVISMDDALTEQFLKQLREHQLKSLDTDDGQLLDTITDEARESVIRNHSKTTH